ncbi:MAG: hypothetical protein R3F24_07160 [Gammaproteobacteria bacterium]
MGAMNSADSGPVKALSRRDFTAGSLQFGAGLLALTASSDALPRVAGDVPAGAPDLSSPAENLRALVRFTASLKERDVPWWYDGTILGVVPGENPRPLLKFEGWSFTGCSIWPAVPSS